MQTQDPGADGRAQDLFSLLYVSEMAAPDAAEIARICEQSRANNLRDGITGLLVFDGKAFCQYVEGPGPAISALLGRLDGDPRHQNMRVLQHGRGGATRRFPSWRLGYAFSADPAAIERVEAGRGDRALVAFDRWLRTLTALEPSDS